MYFCSMRWIVFIVWGTFIITFSACLSQHPIPEDNFYRLAPVKSVPGMNTALSDSVIVVTRFKSDVLYSERPLVYRKSSSLYIRQYHYHKWSDPPPRMLQSYLIDFLRKAQLAGTVISEGTRIRPDYIIYGHIKRFDHLKEEKNDKVVVTFHLTVEKSKNGQITFSKEYNQEREIKGTDFNSLVYGFSSSVSAIYNDFLEDLLDIF